MLFALLGLTGPAVASPEQVWRMEVPIHLRPGEIADRRIVLKEGLVPGAGYTAVLMSPRENERLRLGFFGPAGDPSQLRRETVWTADTPLSFRAIAGRCCLTGDFEGEIRLIPLQENVKGVPVWPVYLLLDIHIQQENRFLSLCHLGWLQTSGRGLLFGLVSMYLFGMINKSHFISRKRLMHRLRLLRREGAEGFVEHSASEIRRLVHRDLTFWRRLVAWLKANPLAIGLFGGSYYETAELHLLPGPNVLSSRLTLLGSRNLHKKLQKDPGRQNRIFAIALDGVRFFGLMRRNRIGSFVLRSPSLPESFDEHRMIWLHPGDQLEQEADETKSRMLWGWSI